MTLLFLPIITEELSTDNANIQIGIVMLSVFGTFLGISVFPPMTSQTPLKWRIRLGLCLVFFVEEVGRSKVGKPKPRSVLWTTVPNEGFFQLCFFLFPQESLSFSVSLTNFRS